MMCPTCGAKSRVDNTINSLGRAVRARTCESQGCGNTFQTMEVVIGPKASVEAAKNINLEELAANGSSEHVET